MRYHNLSGQIDLLINGLLSSTIIKARRAVNSAIIQQEGTTMRLLPILFFFLLSIHCENTFAQSPPLQLITVRGNTDTKFNRVSLFEGGSSTIPFKTQEISKYSGGDYQIDIDIPNDLKMKKNYYFTDLRFWNDKNQNNVKDSDEVASECHFIIWSPSQNKIYMQVYKGEKYPIEYSTFYYNYKSK